MPEHPNKRLYRLELLVCMFLIMATIAVFWQVRNHEFLNYDDNRYVTENHHVQTGMTWGGVIWAFTTTHASNWHPLTWLSHMLDYELFGLNPKGHHLGNLLFHLLNTLLLFSVFRRMTGALWRSSVVAALFALHPLHVESVAWVSERKDVLSTFFWMLTMWAYVCYVERPNPKRYLLVVLVFALGLMSKPMLVTLPFVLLLVDYWPLGRIQIEESTNPVDQQRSKSRKPSRQKQLILRLILEKTPFFALAVASSMVTFVVQQREGAVGDFSLLPLKTRLSNALVSYASYAGKTLWPQGLAVFYPYPSAVPMWQSLAAALFLALISVLVILAAGRRAYLAVAWLWFLGTLVPVIGVVQVGEQSMADRYTYIPVIGLFIVIAWGVSEFVPRWRHRRLVLASSAGVVLSALAICASLQVGHWCNSVTLFEHALDVTVDNHLAHFGLAEALTHQARFDEAIGHYSKALRIKPNYAEAHYNLGVELDRQGRLDEAISYFSKAVQINPGYADAHYNLGLALSRQGNLDEAIGHYSKALQINPDDADVHINLGIVLAHQGSLDEAIGHYSRALQIKPDHAEAHNNLGVALARQGRVDEAVSHFSEAVRIKPDFHKSLRNLKAAQQLLGKDS